MSLFFPRPPRQEATQLQPRGGGDLSEGLVSLASHTHDLGRGNYRVIAEERNTLNVYIALLGTDIRAAKHAVT